MPRIETNTVGAGSLGIAFLALLMRPVVWLLHCLLGRPRDSALAIVVAAAIGAIAINGLFLQRGPHPAPIFAQPPHVFEPKPSGEVVARRESATPRAEREQQVVAAQRPTTPGEATGAVPAVLPRQRPPEAPPKIQPAATRPSPARKDAIAEILAPTGQITAIQRALSEFGYGQISPNGVVGPETRAAIERFERERRMPVTGQISEKFTRELAAVTGRTL